MADFSDHNEVLGLLKESQEADSDQRDAARQAHLFVTKRDGQWEPYWWDANEGKPRYTFDMTSPAIDQVAGPMERSEFSIGIRPAGGESTKEDAELLDGMIRNIENVSNARDTYDLASRNMATAGLDGWQIKQKFVDDDSFDQDLVIEPIASFLESVWFGPFTKSDASDAPYCFVLEALDKKVFKEKFPDANAQSVGDSRLANAYFQKRDQVIIGQVYFIEEKERELLLLTDGRVIEDNEDNRSVLDELAQQGVTVKQRRKRPKNIVKSRLFGPNEWLTPEQTTVFNQIPVIPIIGNFKILENKVTYSGEVEKKIDAQRVLNYSKSRGNEEGALAPRAKYWMTQAQGAGHEDELATLNTNADPVQFYNADKDNPALGPPQQVGGAMINPGLNTISNDMIGLIQQSSGFFDASMGQSVNNQSGVAIEKLQDRGDTGTIKYFRARERAMCRTGRILIDAIPAVYDTERQVRILKEDGSFDMKTLNQVVIDEKTGRPITVNDVSKGKYDVTCSASISFQNKQQETVSAMIEVAQVDPSVMQLGGDIFLNNITSPGMDTLSKRKRAQLIQAGVIPFEEFNDEEKEAAIQAQIEAQQNPPEPDPLRIAAEAEAQKAEAQTNKVNVDAEIAVSKEQRENFKAEQAALNDQVKADQEQQRIDFKQFLEVQQQQMEQNTTLLNEVKTQAETLKIIREAMGVDTIVGPNNQSAYIEQAQNLNESVGGQVIERDR